MCRHTWPSNTVTGFHGEDLCLGILFFFFSWMQKCKGERNFFFLTMANLVIRWNFLSFQATYSQSLFNMITYPIWVVITFWILKGKRKGKPCQPCPGGRCLWFNMFPRDPQRCNYLSSSHSGSSRNTVAICPQLFIRAGEGARGCT